ncbi:MAG: hypothetical protein AAGD34_05055, partial [Pseudomonadota bacterium]
VGEQVGEGAEVIALGSADEPAPDKPPAPDAAPAEAAAPTPEVDVPAAPSAEATAGEEDHPLPGSDHPLPPPTAGN